MDPEESQIPAPGPDEEILAMNEALAKLSDADPAAAEIVHLRLLDDKNNEGIHQVLEMKDGAFRPAFQPAGSEVFAYGREVNDFRTVDYEAISMLNVSATQELARQLDAKSAEVLALQKENAALKAALADNDSKDQAQDKQLAALAKLLEDRAPSAAVTTVR